MTQPGYTQNPFVPEVHQDRSSSQTDGIDQNSADTLRGKLVESILQLVVQAITGVFDPTGGLGAAFAQLVNWAENLLPAQILAPIHDLVTALISLLGYIPIVGPIITQLADIFGFLNDNTTVAQNSANTANSSIAAFAAQLDAGTSGELIIDTFDRAATASLGANWVQYNSTGAGSRGTGGAGTAVWTVSGAFPNTCINQYVTPLLTDIEVARFVLNTALTSTAVQNPAISLMLRCNAAADTFMEAAIGAGICAIGYTVAGSSTVLGATVAIDSNDGDLWEFRAGTGLTGDDPYTFQLLQNGVTVMTRIDTGHASQIGASYRQAGWIDYAGENAFFFVFAQEAPPEMAVFTATDRIP